MAEGSYFKKNKLKTKREITTELISHIKSDSKRE